jgi:LEA14-like dessication related protein
MRIAFRYQLSLLLTLILLAGCATLRPQLERPDIALVDFGILELGLLQQRYSLTLSVQNPNDRAIPVRGLTYGLEIAGQRFARGVSPKAFTLPAYGETEVEVELTTNLISTLRRLQELMENNEDVVSYRLDGKLDVDATFFDGTLPFENTGEIKLTF